MSEEPIVSGMLVYNAGDNIVYLKTATGAVPIGVSSDYLGAFNDDTAANAFAAGFVEEIKREGTRYWNLTYNKARVYWAGGWRDYAEDVAAALVGPQTAAEEAAGEAEAAALTAGEARDEAEEAQADIVERIGDMRVVAYHNSEWAGAMVDEVGNILALIARADGSWKLSLHSDSIVRLAGGAQFIPIPETGRWAFPILGVDGAVLGGFENGTGRFAAHLTDDSTVPSALVEAATSEMLLAKRLALPSGRLFFAGDSLTAGTGGGGSTYPGVLAAALGLPFVNSAQGGTNSTTIGVRQGGIPMLLTLAGDLPADTSAVAVSAFSASISLNNGTFSGTLAGIPVTLTRTSPGDVETYTVKRTSAGESAVTIPAGTRFIADLFAGNELDIHYIQAGRNGNKAAHADRLVIRDNILSMIDRIGHDRFAVLAIKNGDYSGAEAQGAPAYDNIMETNRLIAEAVGWHFIDTRSYLASYAALADAGITPTSTDDAMIADDIPADSFRSDSIHLNAAGYTAEGQFVARWHRGHGWLTGN